MTKELELEQTVLDASPEPKLVESKPVTHNVPARPKGRISRWVALTAVLGIAAGGAELWLQARGFETTDDAQVDGHFDSISSRISGTVVYVNPKAENNQFVEAGTLLVELDPRDYEADLDHAQADLDTRRAEALSAQVTVPIVDASAFNRVRASEAAAQEAIATVNEAEANLTAAQHRLQQDRANCGARREGSRPLSGARREARNLALRVRRPPDGVRFRRAGGRSRSGRNPGEPTENRPGPQPGCSARGRSRSVADGAPAACRCEGKNADGQWSCRASCRGGPHGTAQPQLHEDLRAGERSGGAEDSGTRPSSAARPGSDDLVPLDDIWITANFKETQLKGLKAGESVRIHVDTLDRDFNGYLENLPGAAGPLFSLFPPENATGNYVKVVQRFPVRIRLNPNEDPQHLLRPGMSVEPRVQVR